VIKIVFADLLDEWDNFGKVEIW